VEPGEGVPVWSGEYPAEPGEGGAYAAPPVKLSGRAPYGRATVPLSAT